MADIKDFQVEELKAMAEGLSDTPALLKAISEGHGHVTEAMAKTIEIWHKMSTAATSTLGQYSAFGNVASNLFQKISNGSKDAIKAVEDALGISSQKVKEMFRESGEDIAGFTIMALQQSEKFRAAFPIPESLKSLSQVSGDVLGSVSSDFEKATQAVNLLPKALRGDVNEALKGFQAVAGQFEVSRNAENALITLQAQAGNLGDMFTSFGSDLSGIDLMMDNWGKRMESTGTAVGMSSNEVQKFGLQLQKIPGIMTETIKNIDGAGNSTDVLTAALKINRGSVRDLDTVFGVMNNQMRLFNTSGEDSLKIISRMQASVSGLGIPLDIMRGFINNTSSAFKFFGDNSQAALTIMERMGPALSKSGVGPEGIAEIVGGMVKGIAELDVAQEAFISSQSGGPGGLQGGYQIELLKQQGKSDQVFDMVQGALKKQFGGGPIIGLEEGSKSSGAAAQLTKEVAFLRQGPFGQLAKSNAEAYKLLDSMKTGFGKEAITTPEETTQKAMKAGEAVQDKQTPIITGIANWVERIGIIMTNASAKTAREYTTISGPKIINQLMTEGKKTAAFDTTRIVEAEAIRKRGGAGVGGTTTAGHKPSDALKTEFLNVAEVAKRAKEIVLPTQYQIPMEPDRGPRDLIERTSATAPPQAGVGKLLRSAQAAGATAEADKNQAIKSTAQDYYINITLTDLLAGNSYIKKVATMAVKNGNVNIESRASGVPALS